VEFGEAERILLKTGGEAVYNPSSKQFVAAIPFASGAEIVLADDEWIVYDKSGQVLSRSKK
jgi:hypothetical protein